jgi:uncharacterized membrane protein
MEAGLLETQDASPAQDALAPAPANRMAIAVLALLGIFVAGYLLLHTLGVVGELACGVGDCGRVQRSPWAVFLGLPVPVIGVLGYLALFGTALAGLQPRFAADRRLGLALLGMATFGFGFSAYLTAMSAFRIQAFCQWCLVSAVLATLIFFCSLAELRRGKARA